ncbi:hypothetical protein [Nocardia harenae]|uniref:hypothetical protein n=1 Tax=Nocardia harenae TaxID=358707 RepID=UPI00082CEB58|nr:hypothetical protein [Nocardia harenae]
MAPPLARTNAEARLYLQLTRCPECAEPNAEFHAAVVDLNGTLVTRYSAVCPRCGAHRVHDFRLPDRVLPPPPAREGVRFGGAEPSLLLDPGVWLWYADDRAALARDSTDPAAARLLLATAVAAIDEVLKFLPSGADEVPEAAFVSPEGRFVRSGDPGRFTRANLTAERDRHRR